MICKNQHCKDKSFCAIVEPDNNRIIGLKCLNCGARYLIDEVEIKKSVKRPYWNSMRWSLEMPK